MPQLSLLRTLCFAWLSSSLLLATRPPDLALIAPSILPALGPGAEFAVHAGIFLVVGAAARGWSTGPGWLRAGAAALRISIPFILLIELYQLLSPEHNEPLFSDVFAHLLGTLAGATLAWRFRTTIQRIGNGYAARERLIYGFGLAMGSLLLVGLQFAPTLWLSSLHTWDREFPLLVANEIGGERAWLGEIRHVAIYDRALSPDTIRQLAARPEPRTQPTTGPIAPLVAYDFSGGAVATASAAAPGVAIGLVVEDPDASQWIHGKGLWLHRPTVLSSGQPMEKLTDRLVASGAFTVEVICRPENLTQEGPARIVSLSGGPLERNFTLGQSGAKLVLRVRNPIAGLNGTRRELHTGQLSSRRPQHLASTYDRGALRLFIDGQEQPQALAMPNLGSLDRGTFTLVFLCALVFAISGVGALGASGPVAAPSMLGALFFGVSIVSWLARALSIGQPPDLETSLLGAAMIAVLFPLTRRLCRPSAAAADSAPALDSSSPG